MGYEQIEGRIAIKAWTHGVPFEPQARAQLLNCASLPVVGPHIAVMPDVHLGYGATVGSVIPTRAAVIPAAVGVDIGCGMMAVRTPLVASQLPDNLDAIFGALAKAIPHGSSKGDRDVGAWTNAPTLSAERWSTLSHEYDRIVGEYPVIAAKQAPSQMGTLGGGNHFVEMCLDEEQRVWIMLHSGSRGVGNKIGVLFTTLAREEALRLDRTLPDRDLGWLDEGTKLFDDYVSAVSWAQTYAMCNRSVMMSQALDALKACGLPDVGVTGLAVNCHHNYVNRETHFGESLLVTRKGAVSARLGEYGIIPGSMGTKSFIVRGRGNADSFHSCSHGAGRVMARGAAKKAITVEQHIEDTKHVVCRKDAGVVDESPRAYKRIEDVMAAQEDLVEIVHTLSQVLCLKG